MELDFFSQGAASTSFPIAILVIAVLSGQIEVGTCLVDWISTYQEENNKGIGPLVVD